MKKAINVSIGGSIFYIEEDAYEELQRYLEGVRAHFARFPDSEEIVSDMEARIAERLRMKNGGLVETPIVTKEDVAQLIAVMGRVEDFEGTKGEEDGSGSSRAERSTRDGRRKFMRDPDDKLLFGVSGGLGAYFGVDPIIFRIAFVAATLLWGWGILVYVILWLVTPEASSTTEKMEMRGEPITLASLEEEVRDLAKRHQGDTPAVKNFIARIFDAIGVIFTFIFKTLFPIIGGVFGSVLMVALAFVLLSLLVAFGTALVNVNSPYIDVPFYAILGAGTYYLLVVVIFTTLFLPVLALFLLALAMVRRRPTLPKAVTASLVIVWFIAVSAAGTFTLKSLPAIEAEIVAEQRTASLARTYPLDGFASIEVYDGLKVTVSQGTAFAITATGTESTLASLSLAVDGATLVVRRSPEKRICILCLHRRPSPTLHITLPRVERLEAHDAGSIVAEQLQGEHISIVARDAGRVQGALAMSGTADVEVHDAGRATLTGSTDVLNATASDAGRLSAGDLVARSVTVTATDAARALVYADVTLTAHAKDGSRITYRGNPEVRQTATDASRVEALSGDTATTTREY
jgi:phage shock protein PspC (stress-responsive transcriptional regulator)